MKGRWNRHETVSYTHLTGAKYEMAEMEFTLKEIDGNSYHPVIPEKEFEQRNIPFEVL